MPVGTCVYCSCTDERPCAGGCAWVGPERTLCDQCAVGVKVGQLVSKVIESLKQPTAPTWAARPFPDQQLLVMSARALLDTVAAQRDDEVRLVMAELRELMDALAKRYPEAVAQAQQRELSLKDLVLGLLGPERRVVLVR
jgi:hypothetical protein